MIYHDMIYHIVHTYPGSNILQITEKLLEIRKDWISRVGYKVPKVDWTLPKGKPTRKTVSKHLAELITEEHIALVGGGYVSTSHYVKKHAAELNDSVIRLLKSGRFQVWNPMYAPAAAASYFMTKPINRSWIVQDFLHLLNEPFKNSLFWLDEILRHEISYGNLSPNAFSKTQLNAELISAAWRKHFGKTKLVVVAFAINPKEFLNFITSSPGRELAARHLERSWPDIVKHVNEDVDRFRLRKVEWGEQS